MKSRYIPIVQQPYCCVPTCLQMIMYRNKIALVEQEDLGHALGLIVPEDAKKYFNRVRTGERPPAGYGTQIRIPAYSLDSAFKRLNIPLESRIHTIDYIKSVDMLRKFFEDTLKAKGDTIVCFKNDSGDGGHACVFDYLDGDDVWLVDPYIERPRHRKMKIDELYQRMLDHGASKNAGCWEINTK